MKVDISEESPQCRISFREFLIEYRLNPLTFEKVMPGQSFSLGDRNSGQISRFSWIFRNLENVRGWLREYPGTIPDAQERVYVDSWTTLGSEIEVIWISVFSWRFCWWPNFWSNFKIFMNFRDFGNCLGWLGDCPGTIPDAHKLVYVEFWNHPRLRIRSCRVFWISVFCWRFRLSVFNVVASPLQLPAR